MGRRLRQEIADLLEKCRVRFHAERLALVGAVPAVDLRLQCVADLEQRMIFGSQIANDGGEPRPERIGGNSGLGGRFLGDEIEQNSGDFQSVGIDTIHDGFFLTTNSGHARLLRGIGAKRAVFPALLAPKPGR